MLPVIVNRVVLIHRGVGVVVGHGLSVGVLIRVLVMAGVTGVIPVWIAVFRMLMAGVVGVHAVPSARAPHAGPDVQVAGQSVGV